MSYEKKILLLLLAIVGMTIVAHVSGSADGRLVLGQVAKTQHLPYDSDSRNLFSLSSAAPALPAQIAKVRILSLSLTAKQVHQRLAETIHGRPAQFMFDRKSHAYLARHHHLRLSLPSFNISFPFAVFW